MRFACLCGLAGWCVLLASAAADDTSPPAGEYSPPETFLMSGRSKDYLPHVRSYLRQNPRDAKGAEIAMDMLMFATFIQDQEGIQEAKRHLLFEYGSSLPATYVIRSSKPDDLCEFLKSFFVDADKPLDKSELQRFQVAAARCLRAHGANLADDELWAQIALSASDAETAANCRQQIEREDSDAGKLLAVALDSQLSAGEKFVRLQTLPELKTARAWQRYLFEREFSVADRADMDIQSAVAENLLTDRKFASALEVLTKITKDSADPKLLFYRGWAEGATVKIPVAVATLKKVTEAHPDSPWAAPARELAEAIAELPKNLDDHVAGFEKMFVALREHAPDVVELELDCGETPEERVQILAGLDFPEDGIEFLLRKAGKPLLGYSSRSDGSHFFVDGESSIHRFKEKGPSPHIKLNISPSLTGSPSAYYFTFGVSFSSDPGNLRKSISSLLDSPAFATEESRRDWVRYCAEMGAFPNKVIDVNGERSFRWLVPSVREPKLHVIEIRLTSEGRLMNIVWGEDDEFKCILRCGTKDSMSLTRRKWPDLPVSKGTELGAAEMFRLLRVAVAFLGIGGELPAESTAATPQPVRR